MEYDVIVIGGGASGMMAAGTAAQLGVKVLLLEKNKRLGEKLRITGGGRCNITNVEDDIRVLLKNYGKAEQFLYSAFMKFGIQDTIDYFAQLNVPTKVEARKRAFPLSENANDVAGAMVTNLYRNNVTVLSGKAVSKVIQANNRISSVICDGQQYTAKNYVLATGGTSRPETGSTGDGFGWLTSLGHTVNTPNPSITPLAVREPWVAKASGIAVKDAAISFYAGDKRKFKLNGDILFTHFGISGPLILNNAYKVAELLKTGPVTATIDGFPLLDPKTLDQKIVTTLNEHGSKQLKNVLQYFVPAGLSPLIKDYLRLQIDFDAKTSEVHKEARKLLGDALKALPLTIEKLMGFEKAVVADGGVDLKDIDTRTMQSKKITNLYITGDLLDITRPSGGYSLQLCWTTGYIAGLQAATFEPTNDASISK